MNNSFLTNTSKITFLYKIKENLAKCNEFYFSVSFIKKAGLVLLLDDMKSALKRGAIGKLLTSTYQNFTDIASLEELLILTNIYNNFTCHIDMNCFGESGFHTKGYIFNYDNQKEIVVGSSNITRFALLKNVEWNISLLANDYDDLSKDTFEEFEYLWQKTLVLDSHIIKEYGKMLDYAIEKWDMDYIQIYQSKIYPNYMQRKALKEISNLRGRGVSKALIIAATGSGKTYLAAFDAKNFDAKKVLFIVHRDTILKEAIKTFNNVFNEKVTYGLFVGNEKHLDRDFIFSTNTTMARNLDFFDKEEFDYIVIDEVHHAVADTYKKIINYFSPQFLLGLTATPERMDNESVFDLFEKNVPYELRLRDALLNDLIVPFKYYGISDKLLDYSETDAKVLVKQIADDLHCEFIKENIMKYHPNGKLKALGFCRTIEHAKIMTEKMNQLGYHTLTLTGRNDTGERIKAYKDLEDDLEKLEIIFTVDLLNEGIDIPAVNMVLFLRPTESSTIFIQQLGRGLRKYPYKEYLTVLDFIGNSYTRSVQIALAIGSLSNNVGIDKRLLAEFVREDFKQLDLPIEINIEELSKEEILKAIENTNFNSLQFLKQDYYSFKKYLGIETSIKYMDYFNSDVATDLLRYIKKYGSYYEFLLKIDEDLPYFTNEQREFIKYISSFIPLIRPYEFMIIRTLINEDLSYNELNNKIKEYDCFSQRRFDHSLKNLQNMFYSTKENANKITYVVTKNDKLSLLIEKNSSFLEHVADLIEYGLARFSVDFYGCNDDIKLYFSYTRSTLLQALCNHTFASREGIIWNNDKLYIFIDLKKDASKEEWLLYEDKFVNEKILQWESQTETTFENMKGKKLIDQVNVEIFVRKIKIEDGITLPYIYIGNGILTNPRVSQNIKQSLLFDIILEKEVPEYLKYDFEIAEGK